MMIFPFNVIFSFLLYNPHHAKDSHQGNYHLPKDNNSHLAHYLASDKLHKHKKLSDEAKVLADTAAATHSEAFTKAVETHLMDDKKKVYFKRLDNDQVRESFQKSMKDVYVSRAKEYFQITKNLDEFEESMLMGAYVGVFEQDLKSILDQYNGKLTHSDFHKETEQLQQKLEQRLYSVAATHFKYEDIPDIIKHVGLEGKVKSQFINLDEAKTLLNLFYREGALTDTILRRVIGAYKMKSESGESK
ncbi:hypothetical protein HYT52_03550 [Candidatus Woesearchaeota archaeon]|nr:hypothetical protein [Candidatus Woesearchaeota archaeon]